MDITTIIGASGAALLLVGFVLNEFKILSGESIKYQILNIIGAALLTWYAVLLDSWPFTVLEGVWTIVALWHMCRLASRR